MQTNTVVLTRHFAALLCYDMLIKKGAITEMPHEVWLALYSASNYQWCPPTMVKKGPLTSLSDRDIEQLLQEFEFQGCEVLISKPIPPYEADNSRHSDSMGEVQGKVREPRMPSLFDNGL